MKTEITFSSSYLQDKLLYIEEDIINCYKKGMFLARSELCNRFYNIDGWVSVLPETKSVTGKESKINIHFWADEEVLPFVPDEKVRRLSAEEYNYLNIVETEDGYTTVIQVKS